MPDISYLNWRAAVKKYDPEKKLSNEQVVLLAEALNLSASSYGLQPYHFFLVEDSGIREQIKGAGYGQPQYTDASHLFVIASKLNVTDADIDAYIDRICEVRGESKESLDGYESTMKGALASKTKEEIATWAAKQSYIVLGTLLTVAAEQKIDATPMEGFDPGKVDELLGLKEKGLTATLLVPVGYRAEDDPYCKKAKVRRKMSEILTRV